MKYLLLIVLLLSAALVEADIRHYSTVVQFRKANPCPMTNTVQRTCPDYRIDHIIPLCAGGPDTVANMQWQTKADSYKKDVQERAQCRALRKAAK